MNSETYYIQAKHFTNRIGLEMEDMTSITSKLIFTEKVLISKEFNLKLKLKYFLAEN